MYGYYMSDSGQNVMWVTCWCLVLTWSWASLSAVDSNPLPPLVRSPYHCLCDPPVEKHWDSFTFFHFSLMCWFFFFCLVKPAVQNTKILSLQSQKKKKSNKSSQLFSVFALKMTETINWASHFLPIIFLSINWMFQLYCKDWFIID